MSYKLADTPCEHIEAVRLTMDVLKVTITLGSGAGVQEFSNGADLVCFDCHKCKVSYEV